MVRFLRTLGVGRLGLVVLAGVLFAPVGAHAAWLGYRNDTHTPVIVQGFSVVNNRVLPGKPQVLYPGEIAWNSMLVPGVKKLVIGNAKAPNQPRTTKSVLSGNDDLFYSIQSTHQGGYDLIKTDPPKPPRR